MQTGAELVQLIVAGAVGAALGSLGTLATIRIRLVRLEDRIEFNRIQLSERIDRDERALEEARKEIGDRLDRFAKQIDITMRMLAHIMRALKIDNRALGEDVIARFFTEGG